VKEVSTVSERVHVDIGGVNMGMIIESDDRLNPVLLFVHGGPGMPEHPLTERYPTGLEKLFTVVWWDQRGAGLSYSHDIPAETMTTEQFVTDTVDVTNYLRGRFEQEKIFLMGHSWGSYIAIQAAARSPQLYAAYIGVAQVSDQMASERAAREYMLSFYSDAGDEKTRERLRRIDLGDDSHLPAAYRRIRDGVMHRAGIGTTHAMKSVITGIFLPVMRNREYTLREKINIWRGKAFSQSTAGDEIYRADLRATTTELAVPVYFFSGRYDYTANYTMSADYLRSLIAPIKGFYLFDESAHSPIFEEPTRVLQIMHHDVLQAKCDLADAH